MFMQKVSNLFQKAVEIATAFYFRPDVQEAIAQVKKTAADVVAWIRQQVKEQPEAATAGAIAAWVALTAISTFTVALVLTVLFSYAIAGRSLPLHK